MKKLSLAVIKSNSRIIDSNKAMRSIIGGNSTPTYVIEGDILISKEKAIEMILSMPEDSVLND